MNGLLYVVVVIGVLVFEYKMMKPVRDRNNKCIDAAVKQAEEFIVRNKKA